MAEAARYAQVESRWTAGDGESLRLTMELVNEFLGEMKANGRTQSTLDTYRWSLTMLYQYLPGDRSIRRDTLDRWRGEMEEAGFSAQTINVRVSAANSLLEYCGRRELQARRNLERPTQERAELTKDEYLRLLSTARALEKERTYLLIKVFGSLGLMIQELPNLTVEAAEAGTVLASNTAARIPKCLRKELLDYARREGVASGPLFVTRTGKPMARSQVTADIQAMGRDARVPEEKANPRCLRRYCQRTQAGLRAGIALLLEQSYEQLLEKEQLAIGWNEGRGCERVTVQEKE